MKSDFVKGTVTGTFGIVLKILLNLIAIPLFLRYLGRTDYGFYVFLITFAELLLVVDLGLTTGLIQRLSTYYAEENLEKVKNSICNGQWLYLLLSTLLVIGGSLIAKQLPGFFHFDHLNSHVAVVAFQIIVFEAAINLMAAFYKAILKSNCLYQWPYMIESLYSVITGLGIIVLVILGYGLLSILVFRLIFSVLCLGLCVLKSHQVEAQTLQKRFQVCKTELRDLFGISVHAMMQRISVYISYNLDDFVIARFLTINDVAVIGLVRKIMSVPSQFCFKILEGIFPIFTKLCVQQQHDENRSFFLRISAVINFIVLLMILNIAAIYPEAIHVFSAGKIGFQETAWVSVVIMAYIWSGIIQMPASNYLFACGMHRFQTYTSLVTALVNLGISIILVQKLGLIGVVLGTFIAQCTQHHVLTITVACYRLKIGFFDYVIPVYFKNLLPLGVLGIGLGLSRLAMVHYHWSLPLMSIFLFLFSALSTLAWLSTAATAEEREALLSNVVSPTVKKFKRTLHVA